MIKAIFKRKVTLIYLSFLLHFMPVGQNQVYGEPLPRFELGVGTFLLNLNHYRGSDQEKTFIWPLPYFIYRGENIEAENSMIHGNIYKSGDLRIGIGIMGSLSVNSKDNFARRGMPSLDHTFEIGPVLSWDFWKNEDKKNFLTLYFPIRHVLSLKFFTKIEGIGFFSSPSIVFTSLPQKKNYNTFIQLSVAAMIASKEYHRYFYEVSPQYALPSRPPYSTDGGFSGTHFTVFLSKKIKSFYAFTFLRYDRLDGTSFQNSPLVKQKKYKVIGLGLIWYFYQTESTIERRTPK